MSETRQAINDIRVLKVLAITHPDIIQEAQEQLMPKFSDMIMIRDIYDHMLKTFNPAADYYDKLLFIAVVLRLFNPDALIIDCKLRHRLRSSIAECMGDNGPNASYYVSQARAYMKIKSFKQRVAAVVDDYLNQEKSA